MRLPSITIVDSPSILPATVSIKWPQWMAVISAAALACSSAAKVDVANAMLMKAAIGTRRMMDSLGFGPVMLAAARHKSTNRSSVQHVDDACGGAARLRQIGRKARGVPAPDRR